MAVQDDAAIVCRGLSKHFYSTTTLKDMLRLRLRGRRIDALQSLDLTVAKGQVVGVLGVNGAGKTTLLRVLAGMLTPDAGEVSVLGRSSAKMDARFRSAVCYVVAEQRSFSWRLSGRQNLSFFASLHGLDKTTAKARVQRGLERTGLLSAAERPVREYSTGMRQRLALARGLLGDAQVYLLDEPTRGVDPRHAAAIRGVLREILAERCALLVTHDLQEARELCTRAILIERGSVQLEGDVERVCRGVMG
jgi:ABC-2 type transport system ATP-binding protein